MSVLGISKIQICVEFLAVLEKSRISRTTCAYGFENLVLTVVVLFRRFFLFMSCLNPNDVGLIPVDFHHQCI